MRSGTLDTATSAGNIALAGGGVESASELLLLSLLAGDGGDSKNVLVNALVPLKDLHNLLIGVLKAHMGGVTLLPQELAGAEERLGVLELPTDDRVPLVQAERQIAMRPDPLGIVGVHDSLGSRADGNVLFEIVLAAGKCQRMASTWARTRGTVDVVNRSLTPS